jgi:peptidoglycan hydrolase-like protein with peptidoglycan-binding domain
LPCTKPELPLIWTRGEVEFHRGVFEPKSVLKAKSLSGSEIREDKPVRVFILTLSVLAILVGANVAKAGPSMTDRERLASADPADIVAQEGTQETEDQVGLDKAKRRDVQRRLTRLGFDTKVNGRFDQPTRAVISRWQAARGYPNTGFLSAPQHQALLSESASSARASLGSGDKSDENRSPRRRSGARHHNAGGPVALIGGVVGGLFGRR